MSIRDPSHSASGRSSRLGRICLALALSVPVAAAAGGLTVLHGFDFDDGQYPEGRIVQGPDGRYYGTTYAGGVYGYGTAFAVTSAGSFEILHSFAATDGQQLDAGLTTFPDGNLYGSTPQGTTQVGGSFIGFGGSVFRITTAGALSTLRTFTATGRPDGDTPGSLVDGGDGYLYGTMARGGNASDAGTVFKLAPDGSFGTLHAFVPSEGQEPGGLMRGSDGNLYGSLRYGPTANPHGAIFRITPTGSLTILHVFNGTDGSGPASGFVEMPAGTFYGVTVSGGPYGGGTVFRMTADGTVTTLYGFNGWDAYEPVGGLARGPDGKLYGLAFGGGTSGYGAIFRITPLGKLTVLRLLSPFDGTEPVAAPIFGSDGLLYGTTTQYGGAPGASGSVFSFDALAPQPATLSMTKTCYNEFGECIPPFDTIVGQPYSVQWSSANLDACFASGAWSGRKPIGGQLKVTPTKRGLYVYRLACTGGGVTKTTVVTVSVI
ncbi:MAG: hypothetical protein JSR59_12805 [Proteobacteria bacterium]|nr:hypothetical protein [Pseudomonadota bacterium]